MPYKDKEKEKAYQRVYQRAYFLANREKRLAAQKTRPYGSIAWRKRNPEKMLAHAKLNDAVRYGKIVKPTVCSKCGETGRIEAHHVDYSKPLEVVWLCRIHHVAEHHDGR